MFPIILIHNDLQHLQWICAYNENEELESVLINKKTKELEKKIIREDEVEGLMEEFARNGWVKGYLPDINIYNGETIQTIKIG
jgi:hypothetical protein